MTDTQSIEQQVREVLGGQILQSLTKHSAIECGEIRNQFASVPQPVYNAVVDHLVERKIVRKVKTRDGIKLLAHRSASADQLKAAVDTTRKIRRDAKRRFWQKVFSGQMVEWIDPDTEYITPHYSENATFGLTTEGLDYLDAHEITSEQSEWYRKSLRKPDQPNNNLPEDKLNALIEKQVASGQSQRNAKRALTRYVRKMSEAHDWLEKTGQLDPEAIDEAEDTESARLAKRAREMNRRARKYQRGHRDDPYYNGYLKDQEAIEEIFASGRYKQYDKEVIAANPDVFATK